MNWLAILSASTFNCALSERSSSSCHFSSSWWPLANPSKPHLLSQLTVSQSHLRVTWQPEAQSYRAFATLFFHKRMHFPRLGTLFWSFVKMWFAPAVITWKPEVWTTSLQTDVAHNYLKKLFWMMMIVAFSNLNIQIKSLITQKGCSLKQMTSDFNGFVPGMTKQATKPWHPLLFAKEEICEQSTRQDCAWDPFHSTQISVFCQRLFLSPAKIRRCLGFRYGKDLLVVLYVTQFFGVN